MSSFAHILVGSLIAICAFGPWTVVAKLVPCRKRRCSISLWGYGRMANMTDQRQLNRYQRIAAWIVAALAYIAYLYRYGWKYVGTKFIDAPSFWSGAEIAFGLGQSPYQTGFSETATTLVGFYVHPYVYPPPSLLLLFPLSWFDYPTAAIVILALNHLALIGIFVLVLQTLWPGGLRAPRELIAGFGVCVYIAMLQATRITLGHGQLNLPILFLVLAFWKSLRRGSHPGLAAIPLAAAGALKVYPLLCLGMPLARRGFRTTVWAAGCLLLLTLVSLVVLPASSWPDWIANILPTGGHGKALAGNFSPAYPLNFSLNGLSARLFSENPHTDAPLLNPELGTALTYLASLILVGIALWVSFRSRSRALTEIPIAELGVYLCTIFLIAPISWIHYVVFAGTAAVLVTVATWRWEMRAHAVLSAVCLLLLFQDVIPRPKDPAAGLGAALWMAPQLYVVVVLWTVGVHACLQPASGRVGWASRELVRDRAAE